MEKIITIITLVHNKGKYIQTWARSLAKQTYLDKMKILVTDDGSTDNSLAQIKKFSDEYKLPVEITCNEKNMGLMYSVRNAYRKIDTKYFAVLDADDYYLSSEKVEKAVKFLEKNPDYSAYACNTLNVYPNNENKISQPQHWENKTFPHFKDAPFFQTASTTFRNFFDTKLLDAIDEVTEGHRSHAFQGDAFRNVLAFRAGKFYFENSIDCVWRRDIGIWGTTSKFSQDIANIKSYYAYFDFFRKYFEIDEIAVTCLNISVDRYRRLLNTLRDIIESFYVDNFAIDANFSALLKIGEEDFNKIYDTLLEQYKIYAQLGVSVQTVQKE